MNAVIVGVEGRYAAALTEDGRITRVRNQGYQVGQTVEPERLFRESRLKMKAVGWAAAAAAAVALVAGGSVLYLSPYAYVSLDVNPSIEYVLNRFERVLSATAVNEDGEEILKDVKLTHKPIEAAVRETLDHIASSGYFEDTKPNGLVIAASCQDEKASEKLAQRIVESAQKETGTLNASVEVTTVSVTQEQCKEAKDLGVTPGKLGLVEQVKAAAEDPDSVDTAALLSQPVGEIMDELKASQTGQPSTSSGVPEDSSAEEESGVSSSEDQPDKSEPSQEESSYLESSRPSVDPSVESSIGFPPQGSEEDWESSASSLSSGASSSGVTSGDSSELADVKEPIGKPVTKPLNSEKGKEGISGPAVSQSSMDEEA